MSAAGTPLRYDEVCASVAALEAQGFAAEDPAPTVKVLVLRHITVEGFDTYLKHHLYRRQLRPQLSFSGYGATDAEVLASDGAVALAQPELIVLALALDELDPDYGQPGWTCDRALAQLHGLLDLLVERSTATLLVHNFLPPLWNEAGLVPDRQGLGLVAQVGRLNEAVSAAVKQHAPRLVLIDWQALLRRLGAASALDERGRYLWRAPFRHAFLDGWAQQVGTVVCALRGRAKKVLVLDCDHTLWGGVVGEDGLDGIALDPQQYPGRVFFDFQTTVLHLAERGVLLALCSKNNEADVFEVLDKHPACRLKRQHLSSWRIDWHNKADNIQAIAAELNLGLDAFVFVDDSPQECALVRQMLPQVTVLQVPKRLVELPSLLLQDGWFDTLQSTEEDRKRSQLYQSEAQRKQVRSQFGDLGAYLQSLQTVASIHPATPAELARVAQLTQKTNQFNLCTRRYAESDLQSLQESGQGVIYALSARDRFGSLGLVGVMIFMRSDAQLHIDSFLMSCRALGRRLELAMVSHCMADIGRRHPGLVCSAQYIATAKNAQVADFWARVGFDLISDASGQRAYKAKGLGPHFELADNGALFVQIEES